MTDNNIPKFQIREKTPEESGDSVPDSKLLKKIKEERIKLHKEISEWERVIKQLEGYKENIKDLERKRKEKEVEVKNLLDHREKLKQEINVMKNLINESRNNIDQKDINS